MLQIFFIHHKFPRFIFSCTHTFVHLVAILFSLIKDSDVNLVIVSIIGDLQIKRNRIIYKMR